MKDNHWYLILVPFFLWFLDEIFIFKPAFFFVTLALGLLIIALGVRALIKKRSPKFWPVFILAPALFFLSFSFYSAIIVGQLWIQIIFLFNVWFVFNYLKNIYHYFSLGTSEREIKLKRLLLSGSFLSAFALAAVLYGLPIFLNWPFLLLLILFIIISFALFTQFLVFVPSVSREQKTFLGINILILAEFAGVLFLLPLNFNILGLLVALMFYLLILLNDWREENKLNLKNIKWPIIIGSLIIIIILLSARWL